MRWIPESAEVRKERMRRLDFDFNFSFRPRILSWIEFNEHKILVWCSIAICVVGLLAALKDFVKPMFNRQSHKIVNWCSWCKEFVHDWESHVDSSSHWSNAPK